MNSCWKSLPRFNDTDCNITEYSASVLALSLTSIVMSIIGSLVIFGTYLSIPEIQKLTRKLIVSLTVADFLTAAGYTLGASNYAINDERHDGICEIQSYITTYSSLVSFWLTVMTAVHIFTTVVYQSEFTEGPRLVWYNAVSWIIPGVIITVAGANQVLGSSNTRGTGPWCWVKADRSIHPVMWQWVTGKGWEIACYLITTTLYVLLKFYLYLRYRHEGLHHVHPSLRDEDRNFLYVWFVFYLARLWGTVRFLILVVNPTTNMNEMYMKVLLHFQAAGDPAQAFCNCILFCVLDRTVRKRLFRSCSYKRCQYEELQGPAVAISSISGDGKERTEETTPIIGNNLPTHGGRGNERLSMNSHRDDDRGYA